VGKAVEVTTAESVATEAAAPAAESPAAIPAEAPLEAPAIPVAEAAVKPADEAPKAGAAAAGSAAGSASESTLRVDVALLNRMMNLVGELVLTRNQVLQATQADPRMTMLSRRLDMVTADLRESVMKARMQPVSNIFSKMPRIVRDVSQTLGRKVRLEMEGQETELDKSLLEAIKDPLTHAVRNSLDHGIEPPEVRLAAGKEAEGLLQMRAMQVGSHVIVEVQDDGAGINPDRIRQKAIEKELVTPERAAQMAERELLQLIFLPGFSTAKEVTKVSGRGVGMDVVRTNVEKIGGKVEIDSRVGKGTTLRMRIPLTLAIIPALIVRSLGQSYALPQGALSELVHVPPERAGTSSAAGVSGPAAGAGGGTAGNGPAGQLHRGAGRRWAAVRAGGGRTERSGRDCGEAAERGAEADRAVLGSDDAGERRSGADPGPGRDRVAGGSERGLGRGEDGGGAGRRRRRGGEQGGVPAGGGGGQAGRGGAGRRAQDRAGAGRAH
jgi:chemotaxis protein histidine kinase CheA